MNKKLLSLVASVLLVTPTLSLAIGLGSVRTYSSLNQKLKAEIPILSMKEKGRVTVALASNAEFAKRGVARADMLNDLSFKVVERNGRAYVRISSKKQISAPYMNFILQLNSDEGVVSREYAIFLDPVMVGGKKKNFPKLPKASPYRPRVGAASKANQRASAVRPKNTNVSGSQSYNPAVTGQAGQYGPVRKGETLWSIAAHTRPSSSVSVKQMVKLIKRANRKTLSRGLPSGVMLKIPAFDGYQPYTGGYAPMPATSMVKKKPR